MPQRAVAVFISPHGFGHAARASAVMDAMAEREPALRFEIFTAVPEWFFADTLRARWRHHEEVTDLGLVQRTAMDEDPVATAQRLQEFLPPPRRRVERLARRVSELGCAAVVSDISPLGTKVAARAGLPAVLIENFTWDLIYAAYGPPLDAFVELAREHLGSVDVHLQCEPVCAPAAGAHRVAPVSRPARSSPDVVRRLLEVPADARLVLLTMGGLGWAYSDLGRLESRTGAWFVVPGGSPERVQRGRLVSLPHRSGFHHPDLVGAADVVVGKLGYSTVAEVAHAGSAFLYLPRTRFPESPVLEAFVREHLAAAATDANALGDGSWLEGLEPLLAAPRSSPVTANGREAAAERILDLIC